MESRVGRADGVTRLFTERQRGEEEVLLVCRWKPLIKHSRTKKPATGCWRDEDQEEAIAGKTDEAFTSL